MRDNAVYTKKPLLCPVCKMLPFFGIDKHCLIQCVERDNAVCMKKPLLCPACKNTTTFLWDRQARIDTVSREKQRSLYQEALVVSSMQNTAFLWDRQVQFDTVSRERQVNAVSTKKSLLCPTCKILPLFGIDKHGLTQCPERPAMKNTTFLWDRQARFDTMSRERQVNAVYTKKPLLCPACKILPFFGTDKHVLTQCLERDNAVYIKKPLLCPACKSLPSFGIDKHVLRQCLEPWLCPACKMLPSFEEDKHVLTVTGTLTLHVNKL